MFHIIRNFFVFVLLLGSFSTVTYATHPEAPEENRQQQRPAPRAYYGVMHADDLAEAMRLLDRYPSLHELKFETGSFSQISQTLTWDFMNRRVRKLVLLDTDLTDDDYISLLTLMKNDRIGELVLTRDRISERALDNCPRAPGKPLTILNRKLGEGHYTVYGTGKDVPGLLTPWLPRWVRQCLDVP